MRGDLWPDCSRSIIIIQSVKVKISQKTPIISFSFIVFLYLLFFLSIFSSFILKLNQNGEKGSNSRRKKSKIHLFVKIEFLIENL